MIRMAFFGLAAAFLLTAAPSHAKISAMSGAYDGKPPPDAAPAALAERPTARTKKRLRPSRRRN